MDAEKIRNMTDAELQQQQRELNDQLFRLKFQMKMGQTESLNKLRGLRKDVARVKTIQRQKQLGITVAAPVVKSSAPAVAVKSAPAKKEKAVAGKTTAKARKK